MTTRTDNPSADDAPPTGTGGSQPAGSRPQSQNPARKIDDAMSISVFFPCHNEQDTIEPLVQRAYAVLAEISDDFEILIVDDGSTDQTGAIANRLAEQIAAVRVVHHPVNRGYGAALQSGFRAARKDLVFYTDGDGQFDIDELVGILPLVAEADVVSCYRLNRREGWIRRFNAWGWALAVRWVLGLRLRDIDCAFKLYRRAVIEQIDMKSTGALIDAEMLARAQRKGFRIVQHGVHHYPRTAGTPSGARLSVILRAFRELFTLRKDILHQDP